MKTQGLGRGLSALLSGGETVPIKKTISESNKNNTKNITKNVEKKKLANVSILKESKLDSPEYKYIPIKLIDPNPYQPRKEFDEAAIDELALSISNSGFITPILVTKSGEDGRFTLVAGERRLRACKKLGLFEIPAVAKDLNTKQMMQISIVENVQRKNLNPVEEAEAYEKIHEKLKMTSSEISKMVGLPSYYVSQKMRLMQLPDSVKDCVRTGEIAESVALTLLKLHSEDAIVAAAKIVMRQNMTKIAAERLVEKILQSHGLEPKGRSFYFRSKYQYMIDAFKDTLGWDVKLKNIDGKKGKIEIEFTDEINLKDIYKRLEKILE